MAVNDQATGVIQNAIALLDSFDGRVATSTIVTNYVTTGSAPEAHQAGGIVHSDIWLAGERGPELVIGGKGSRVVTAGQTRSPLAPARGETARRRTVRSGPTFAGKSQVRQFGISARLQVCRMLENPSSVAGFRLVGLPTTGCAKSCVG